MLWPVLALQHRQILEIPHREGEKFDFELFVASGYCFGIAGKLLLGNITYVLIVYVLDLAMVVTDILLTLRNMALDKLAERREVKEKENA